MNKIEATRFVEQGIDVGSEINRLRQTGTLRRSSATGFRFHMKDPSEKPWSPITPRRDKLTQEVDQRGRHNLHEVSHPNFTGWKKDDVVRGRFTVNQQVTEEGEKIIQLVPVNPEVALKVEGVKKDLGKYYLSGLSLQDKEAISDLGFCQIDATLQVTSGEDNIYTTKFFEINGVQEVFSGNSKDYKKGENVLLEGEVKSYTAPPDLESSGYVVITLGGTDFAITTGGRYLSLVDGKLPIIVDSNPQQGDTIQMLISYYPPGFNQQFAVADREVFLVQPNKKREQAYEQQRQLVKKSLLEIAQITDPQTIRDIHGKIINDTRYYSNNNPMETRSNRVALTAAERKELARSVAEKIPEKSEQPLDLWGSELTILNLETTQELFGVDTLYSMSQKQFLDFCMDIANGRQRPQIRDERKVGTFFASVKELLPSLEYEDVLQRIVIMHYLMRPQQSPVGDFVLPFEDMDRFEASPYMIEASLVNNASQELASIVSERTTKTFCEVAEKILGKNKPSVDQMYWIKDLMESNIDEGAEREPYEDLLRQLEEKLELAYY